jgi:antitoxin ParD1/3/4
MNRAKITISMPEKMQKFVERKVKEGSYGSVSEYFRELVRLDERLDLARQEAARNESLIRSESSNRFDRYNDYTYPRRPRRDGW